MKGSILAEFLSTSMIMMFEYSRKVMNIKLSLTENRYLTAVFVFFWNLNNLQIFKGKWGGGKNGHWTNIQPSQPCSLLIQQTETTSFVVFRFLTRLFG